MVNWLVIKAVIKLKRNFLQIKFIAVGKSVSFIITEAIDQEGKNRENSSKIDKNVLTTIKKTSKSQTSVVRLKLSALDRIIKHSELTSANKSADKHAEPEEKKTILNELEKSCNPVKSCTVYWHAMALIADCDNMEIKNTVHV
ncbi:hypothetical protein CDIK_1807 [Cucumispora dikerogammari]|nr:hypothetical protein CDIK_1807 [Cucumispora dikerogammari]